MNKIDYMAIEPKNTTSIDRNGNLSIIRSSGFNGTLLELKKLIDNTIREYGEKTECRFDTFSTKGYLGANIIITKVRK